MIQIFIGSNNRKLIILEMRKLGYKYVYTSILYVCFKSKYKLVIHDINQIYRINIFIDCLKYICDILKTNDVLLHVYKTSYCIYNNNRLIPITNIDKLNMDYAIHHINYIYSIVIQIQQQLELKHHYIMRNETIFKNKLFSISITINNDGGIYLNLKDNYSIVMSLKTSLENIKYNFELIKYHIKRVTIYIYFIKRKLKLKEINSLHYEIIPRIHLYITYPECNLYIKLNENYNHIENLEELENQVNYYKLLDI